MDTRRVGTTLAACALIALGACSKEVGNNAEPQPGVGAKLNGAIERTEQKLSNAGERAKEGVADATEKTQETLNRASESLKAEAARVKPGEVPYAARQAVPGATPPAATPAAPTPLSAAITTAVPADNPATTTTLSSGPTTTIKMSGIPADTRVVLNDAAITASIKADLLRDPDLSVLKIDVDTHDGVVTLNGLAANDAARTRAERMAQSVKGVREVRNHLTTKQA
jgi:Predicted periplasmic or secreted lipoprotein